MKCPWSLMTAAALVLNGCSELKHTNPFDPQTVVTIDLVGPNRIRPSDGIVQYIASVSTPSGIVGAMPEWTSTDPNVIELVGSGQFRARRAGAAIIRASFGPHHSEKLVTVDAGSAPRGIRLRAGSVTLRYMDQARQVRTISNFGAVVFSGFDIDRDADTVFLSMNGNTTKYAVTQQEDSLFFDVLGGSLTSGTTVTAWIKDRQGNLSPTLTTVANSHPRLGSPRFTSLTPSPVAPDSVHVNASFVDDERDGAFIWFIAFTSNFAWLDLSGARLAPRATAASSVAMGSRYANMPLTAYSGLLILDAQGNFSIATLSSFNLTIIGKSWVDLSGVAPSFVIPESVKRSEVEASL